MLGEQLGETKGKRLVRRVTSIDPPTVEVTFEDAGHMLGIPTSGTGTYTSVIRADGSIFGEGLGLIMTQEGDGITWTGTGVGKFLPTGAISYRGMLFLRTTSVKLAGLNNACAAFEYEVAADATTTSKTWEWK
ncbi:MAG: hypothetical protein ABSG84_05860 [Acidobacteriaceae bacterium]|jgi:hypothetical protein